MMLYKVNTLVVHYKQEEHMVFIVVAGEYQCRAHSVNIKYGVARTVNTIKHGLTDLALLENLASKKKRKLYVKGYTDEMLCIYALNNFKR
jgi:hypothetical protein